VVSLHGHTQPRTARSDQSYFVGYFRPQYLLPHKVPTSPINPADFQFRFLSLVITTILDVGSESARNGFLSI
jgi:hypothetical protein